VYDPVPADAVQLCCPRCLLELGHCTRTRLYLGGVVYDGPQRLPCRNCGYRFRWGPDPGPGAKSPAAGVDSPPPPVHTNR
jgi:hypothetical protein